VAENSKTLHFSFCHVVEGKEGWWVLHLGSLVLLSVGNRYAPRHRKVKGAESTLQLTFERGSDISLPLCALGCALRTHHCQRVQKQVGLTTELPDSWLGSSAASPLTESCGGLLQAQDVLAARPSGVGVEGRPQGWDFHALRKVGCRSKSSQMQTGWCLPEGAESGLVLCGFKAFRLPRLSHVSLVADDPAARAVSCSDTACTCSSLDAPMPFSSCLSPRHPVLLVQQTLPLARCGR